MQPPETGHTRTLRLALVAATLFVLLGVVAFASRSGFGHATGAAPTPAYVSWAMSLFLVLFVLMIPFAAWAYSVSAREWRTQNVHRKSMQARIVRSLGIFAIVLFIFAARAYLKKHHALPTIYAPWLHPGKGRGANATTHKPYNPEFEWPVLWATILVLAAGAALFWWKFRSLLAPSVVREEQSFADDVSATITDAIDDLEAEPDPRRAVIAAYARMETTLGRHGLQRRPSETPIEYLRRALLGLTSHAEPVTRLTGLFELAKFSRRPIGPEMKDDAISALRAIHDDLQAAPA
jgi:hypothetical protein